ncbi:MAG: glycosyltransferase family 4 protein [Rubrobacter sp.]|nr:glycosyltransferase family 4 protein [Rubrobacter sp.]
MMPLQVVVTFGKLGKLLPEQDQPMGGIKTATLGLCYALARRGHDVHLFGQSPYPGRYDGVTFHDRGEFARFGEMYQADVLVAIPEVLPLLMPLRARARVVWSGNIHQMNTHQAADYALLVPWSRDSEREGKKPRRGKRARLYDLTRFEPLVDCLIAGSQWQAERVRESLNGLGTEVTVKYLGVPLEHYRGPAPVRDRHRLVYASEAKRGLHALLRLFPEVRSAVPEAELHIFERKGVDALPDQDAVQPGVHWRGRVSKSALAHEFRSAGLMAYPNQFKETFCLAVAEAQAAGLPVVTSDLAALSERVSHGVDGFLIPGQPDHPGYGPAFVEAVVRLLREDDLWTRMSAEAASKAHRLYNWDTIAAGWEQELEGLVAGREPIPPRLVTELNLLDPSSLAGATDQGASVNVPAEVAEHYLREAWVSYGYPPNNLPGLPSTRQ